MSKIHGNINRKYTTLFSSDKEEAKEPDALAENDDMRDLLDELPEATDDFVNRDPLEDYEWAEHMAKIFSAPPNTTYADSTGVVVVDRGDDAEFENIPALERARHMKSRGWLNVAIVILPVILAGYVLVKCMEEVISD